MDGYDPNDYIDEQHVILEYYGPAFISKKVKRAELVSFNNDFYMRRSNYRARVVDADELESSIKTLEAHLKRKAAREKIVKRKSFSKLTLSPQSIMNKDRLINARRRMK
jgi:hypothetical protein